jgi:hypothetical protein
VQWPEQQIASLLQSDPAAPQMHVPWGLPSPPGLEHADEQQSFPL